MASENSGPDDFDVDAMAAELIKAQHELEASETSNTALRIELHTTKLLVVSTQAANQCMLTTAGQVKAGHLEELRKLRAELDAIQTEVQTLREG